MRRKRRETVEDLALRDELIEEWLYLGGGQLESRRDVGAMH